MRTPGKLGEQVGFLKDIKKVALDYERLTLSFKSLNDAQIAPDGRKVAFVAGDFWKEDTKFPRSRIWTAMDDEVQPITFGPRTDKTPRWSPDGKRIAFLSDRSTNGRFQIAIVGSEGGEVQTIVSAPGSIDDFAWSTDGTRIAYLMHDPEPGEEAEGKPIDPLVFERNPRFGRVWVVNVETKETQLVTQGDLQVWEFGWAPDGRQHVLLVSDEPYDSSWYQSRLAVVDATGGEPRTIFENSKQLALPRFSHDGKRIAFISCIWSDRNTIGGDLWIIDSDGSHPRNLTKDRGCSISYFEWSPDDRTLTCIGTEYAAATILRVNCEGQVRKLWSGPVAFATSSWPSFSMSTDQKTIAVSREDLHNPIEVWVATLQLDTVSWKQLTRLNSEIASTTFGEPESISWKAADGLDIQGFIIMPPGYKRGKPYPLITVVHGGPAWYFGCLFQFPGYNFLYPMLPSSGYALFLPNPRGSLSRGAAFTELNLGDMGGRDFQDIMSGIDYLVTQGIADPKRLGVSGGSYGGFMTSWAVTQTERFKAAVECWGIANWVSFHGTSALHKWDEIAYKADPYEANGVHHQFSPLTHIQRVKTPTLIIHGELDQIVPVSQGYEFFRALTDHNVKSELVIYPREGHGPLLERKHLIDASTRIMQWFEKYIPAENT